MKTYSGTMIENLIETANKATQIDSNWQGIWNQLSEADQSEILRDIATSLVTA